MASAALKQPEPEPDGQNEGADTPRDFEAEAREHGWAPKEDFKGDPNRWIDAETFMKRADEMMPLLKATNARQKREIEQLKKDFKRASATMESMEKRAYERAVAELEQKHTDAVQAGDLKAANEAVQGIRELKPVETGPKYTQNDLLEAFDAFRDEHSWYDRGNLGSATETEADARIYADRIIQKRLNEIKQGEEPPPSEFMEGIVKDVFAKYPGLNDKTPRAKPASPVEGGTAGRPRGSGKSWDNLPAEAKRTFERMQARDIWGVKKTGDKEKDLAASRAYYARNFDWEGYKDA